MSKHTPGKLEIVRTPYTTAIACDKVDKLGNRLFVGHVVDEGMELSAEEEDANADRLVACWNAMDGIADPVAARAVLDDWRTRAAPDLFDAAEAALAVMRGGGRPVYALAKLIAAIAKAGGDPS